MTDDRAALAGAFVAKSGWGDATRIVIAGDASNRSYQRLTRADGSTAVLMDAPPQKGEDTRPFIQVTELLRAQGLSAPALLASDIKNGFLLIEDLGDDLFARVMERDPALERPLYEAAVDVLLDLHRAPLPDLPAYDSKAMTPLAALAYDWYLPGATGVADQEAKSRFEASCATALAVLDPHLTALVQRDYHAENLLWLPDRSGSARVGLLDYQDAMRGHPAYDLVSILQDARRDVSPRIERDMIARYTAGSGLNSDEFAAAYALLGMQRNMRILGVFARLSLCHGKPHYVDLIPRVWEHVMRNLQHPALAKVAPIVTADLPAPTPIILQTLKDKCATISRP